MSWKKKFVENWGRLGMKYKLGEIVDITMGQSPKSEYYNTEGKGYPFLQGNRTFGFKYPTFDTYTSVMTKQAKSGDVIMSVRAPVGDLNITPVNMCLGRGVCSLRMKNGNQDFLFYMMKYYIPHLLKKESGTVFGSVNRNDISGLEVDIPEDVKVQKKIARYLEMMDDKIELNNAINNNLLEQALTLYATQFSSLELNGCIGDYCSVKSGFAFKSSWWTNCGVKVIKIGSINQDNLDLLECCYVDEDKADKAKDFVVKAGDLLIAMTGATIGKFAMVPYSSEVLLVNQRVGKFFLGNNPVERLPFIYCTLKQPEVYGEVVNRGQGSAQPNISASDIMSIPCVIPSQDAINDFNDTSQPLFDLIISNQRENQQLFELRNALLPKLMSGELDVSDIEF